jgi:hypothetical protein
VVAVPMWLIVTIAISSFLILMLVIVFAWSRWMTRPEASEE